MGDEEVYSVKEYMSIVKADLNSKNNIVGNVSYNPYDNLTYIQTSDGKYPVLANDSNTTTVKATPSVDALMSLANILIAQEKNSISGSIAVLGEDEFKRRSKNALTEVLMQEIAKKIKFTILRHENEQTVTTKARVYAFSEQELRNFIENLVKSIT